MRWRSMGERSKEKNGLRNSVSRNGFHYTVIREELNEYQDPENISGFALFT
jgi:hypothetical protein